MREPLPRPVLVVTNNLVAQALEHTRALRVIYKEMEARELERARRTEIIVKLTPAGIRVLTRTRFTSLLD